MESYAENHGVMRNER